MSKIVLKNITIFMYISVMILMCSNVKAEEIPVEKFFKQADIESVTISPGGDYYAATIEKEGKFRLAVISLKTNKLLSVVSLRNGQSVSDVEWVNKQRYMFSPRIKVGRLSVPVQTNELFAANFDGTKQKTLVGSKDNSSSSSGGVNYPIFIIDNLINNKKYALVQQFRGNGLSDLFRFNVFSGKKYKVISVPGRYSKVIVDHNKIPRFAVGTELNIQKKEDVKVVYYRENNHSEWAKIQELKEEEAGMVPLGFTKDNKKVYVHISAGAKNINTNGIFLYDPKNQSLDLVWENKSNVDITSVIYDKDMNKRVPIGVRLDDGKPVYYFFDENHPLAKKYRQIQNLFKGEFISIRNYTNDGNIALVNVYSDKDPGKVYKFDFKTNKITYLLSYRPWIDPKKMVDMEPIHFKARDGLDIYGYLLRPKGKKKNLPMVLNVHGGPYGIRDYWEFRGEDQFLANRGYAVLKVNYRGSGGYGLNFVYQAYKQVGAAMQDDLTDATLWAIKQGIADKNRICIYGASYGGYASLMGVVKEPDLYKCAIPYAGVYDIDIQRTKSDTRYTEQGKRFLKNAWNAYDEKFVKARSPYYHLDKLKAALFFVHGEDDFRVPIENYEEVSKKLDKMNYPYEHLIKDKEPHGFYLEKNNYELYNRMAKFLKKNIGN